MPVAPFDGPFDRIADLKLARRKAVNPFGFARSTETALKQIRSFCSTRGIEIKPRFKTVDLPLSRKPLPIDAPLGQGLKFSENGACFGSSRFQIGFHGGQFSLHVLGRKPFWSDWS